MTFSQPAHDSRICRSDGVIEHRLPHPQVQRDLLLCWLREASGARIVVVGDPVRHPLSAYLQSQVLGGPQYEWRVAWTRLVLAQMGEIVEDWPLPAWVMAWQVGWMRQYSLGAVLTCGQCAALLEGVR
jgi:hypothetical protein